MQSNASLELVAKRDRCGDMPQCLVKSCGNYYGKTRVTSRVIYHMLPTSPELQKKWIDLCTDGKDAGKISVHARVCSEHFSPDCYQRDLQHELLNLPLRKKFKSNAVPDRKLPKKIQKVDVGDLKDGIEGLSKKLCFMAGLELKCEENVVVLPQYDITLSLEKIVKGESLNKMQIMEDVREGCNVQPSSPGHAEQRPNGEDVKPEPPPKNGFEEGDLEAVKEEMKDEDEVKAEEDEEQKIVDEPENGESEKRETGNEESCSNGSSLEDTSTNKRKSDEQETSGKRLRGEIQENFNSRDKIFKEIIDSSDCNSVDQIQTLSDQILAEIRTLNELAREKEREWNNIIHLKKMKEELLLRVQRRKQVMLIGSEKMDNNEVSNGDAQNDERLKGGPNQSILKANLLNPQKKNLADKFGKGGSLAQRSLEVNGSLDYRQNRQRPVIDVQSIIADYRQRHPETVPRRGRRIRNSQHDPNKASNVLNFSALALSGCTQVHQNLQGLDVNNDLGLLISAMDASRQDGTRTSNNEPSLLQGNETSFKDMLLQFARLSQSERSELIQNAIKPPPPYPEVTVHPVPTTTTSAPTNSLLHGILTKSPSKSNTKTSFSPTLARLLTAPERGGNIVTTSAPTNTPMHPTNMSISEILSNSKSRNEITITPVVTNYEQTIKVRSVAQFLVAEEEEAEDSADRLVIDESNGGRGDAGSDIGDEVPQCQGCNQKPAQFVCAGCGNQWYCSRDCQVSAWDEHSEVCSG